ncbi:MAG: FtsX-like permease family protein, partial [Rikenellaceae bacterium]
MIQLKIIFRSWARNTMSTFISATSLIIGLVCSTILILFVLGEYRVKNALGNTDKVYLAEQHNVFYNDKSVVTDSSNPKLSFDISEKYGDVEMLSIITHEYWNYKNALQPNIRGLYAVTPDFAKMFTIPVKEGNLAQTLASKSEIAVTNSYMQYLYGKDAVVGDRILAESGGNTWVNGVMQPKTIHDVVITTILDETSRTPFSYKALIGMPILEISAMSGAFSGDYHSIIKLRKESNIKDLNKKIIADTTIFKQGTDLIFTPFSKVYFDTAQRGNLFGSQRFIVRRDPSLLIISLTISIAILLIAMFNYINITMTRAKSRLRNIAGQRIFGASKWSMRWQIALDTLMLVLISFALSLFIIKEVIPFFNNFMDCEISLSDLLLIQNAAIIVGVLLVLVVCSSAYILVKMEISSPINILKNQVGHNIQISSVMVIAQFVISVALIAFSMNISRQVRFIAYQRPASEYILRISSNTSEKLPTEFTDIVKTLSIVENYTSQGPLPNMSMSVDGKSANMVEADKSVFDFYGIKLLEGRDFVESDARKNIIINEAALSVFNVEKPVLGKKICFNGDTSTVIGVVKDFIYEDAHKAIQPLILYNYEGDKSDTKYWRIYLKVNCDTDVAIDKITEVWNDISHHSAGMEIKTVAEIYKEMHPSEIRLMKVVNIFMYISIALTALGLFGLSFYSVEKRSKEIALRKIHGSTTLDVIVLLCRTFTVWIAIAIAIAIPIAVYLTIQW